MSKQLEGAYEAVTMQIELSGLERFKLEGMLGEGADLEVFAATDLETSKPVVVKRPHSSLVSRSQHKGVEERLGKAIGLREQLGSNLSHVSELIAYTSSGNHDEYFGDSLGESYSVTVEERAKGLPLVGNVMDGIRRKPIGLPQKLFAIHPIVPHPEKSGFVILRDLLEVAEVFYEAGYMLMDLSPQNVFFDLAGASITVIDVTNLAEERPASRRHSAYDMHDFYLELFKWYLSPANPPTSVADYGVPHGTDSVPMFAQNLNTMIGQYSTKESEPDGNMALGILNKIKQRGYADLQAFRLEFDAYLDVLENKYETFRESPDHVEAWHSAKEQLNDPYWQKFIFDPQIDLAPYSR